MQLHLYEVNDNVKQKAQILKEEVKKMLQSTIDQNIIQKLHFIGLVHRFGVSYHFQQEIDQALEQIHITFTNDYTFDKDGNFNQTLANDIQGLCSLCEASHLRTRQEDILEEACNFKSTQLKSLANQLSPSLVAQINHCLRKPLNKSVPFFEARYYMTLYEQDPSHNDNLLNFAKVNFNILQKMHQKEVGRITKWWKTLNSIKKVPYARDRLVEGYLWPLAMSYKPEFSNGRMFMGKLIAVASLIDDTYDAYGTVHELELFTKAIQRWDISLIRSLPQCMRVVFETVVELCEELKLVTAESGKSSFVVPHFKQAICNLVGAYMVEAKWCHESYIPTYDEYKVNGILTSVTPLFVTAFTGLGEFATNNLFNWIFSNPIILEAASIIGRVLQDLGSHKFEQQRVHVASSVECCMKTYGISQAEAYNLLHKDVEDYWKVINEECLRLNDIPKSVLDCIVKYGTYL